MSFSLKYLFVLIALAAIFTAALIYAPAFWDFAAVHLTVLIFLAATIGVLLQRLSRNFWLPFCVVGWFYLAIAFVPANVNRFAFYLVSGLIVTDVDSGPNDLAADGTQIIDPISGSSYVIETFKPSAHIMEVQRFADVIDTLAALLLAAAAGVISVLLIRQKA